MLDEQLMAALLRLDGVPGFLPSVRDLRRIVSRRLSALAGALDAIAATPALDSPDGIPVSLEGIPASLEEILGSIWDQKKAKTTSVIENKVDNYAMLTVAVS
ncbi:hypothetical protein HPP92_022543 [Vanilla planifolia]|uniref:BAG domain-containing protein n=1 Tax=Vanilla planifolia TaxID=51239 RepID=A0A835UFS0_VANPL|nr:hypothetical protein HPP92_022543 [Vanilla planifolia]